jgi:hypothetical protein
MKVFTGRKILTLLISLAILISVPVLFDWNAFFMVKRPWATKELTFGIVYLMAAIVFIVTIVGMIKTYKLKKFLKIRDNE